MMLQMASFLWCLSSQQAAASFSTAISQQVLLFCASAVPGKESSRTSSTSFSCIRDELAISVKCKNMFKD